MAIQLVISANPSIISVNVLAGVQGPRGNTILNGTTVPSSGTGINGDFYINTATWMIYGPKENGGWPPGVSLISG